MIATLDRLVKPFCDALLPYLGNRLEQGIFQVFHREHQLVLGESRPISYSNNRTVALSEPFGLLQHPIAKHVLRPRVRERGSNRGNGKLLRGKRIRFISTGLLELVVSRIIRKYYYLIFRMVFEELNERFSSIRVERSGWS